MDDFLYKLVDFAEENWVAFLQRCKESGISEKVAEMRIEELRLGKEQNSLPHYKLAVNPPKLAKTSQNTYK